MFSRGTMSGLRCVRLQKTANMKKLKTTMQKLEIPETCRICGIHLSPTSAIFLPLINELLMTARTFSFLPVYEPVSYLLKLCEDCNVNSVITSSETSPQWNFTSSFPIGNNLICGLFAKKMNLVEDVECLLSYVIRTSGSTGEPKIVRVPRCCIEPNIDDLKRTFRMTEKDIVCMCSPLTFDPSVVDIMLALTSGCRLVVADENLKRNPTALAKFIFEENFVTVLQMTPSLLMRFSPETLRTHIFGKNSRLRILALGGEQFPDLGLLRKYLEPENQTRIFNLYGITEVSCWAACHEVTDLIMNPKLADIGISGWLNGIDWELKDTADSSRTLSKDVGTVGELFIGGSERKCLLPGESWETAPNLRASGDIVRVEQSLDNGEIHLAFLGRKNVWEIKRNGQRVDLREIEKIAYHPTDVHNAKAAHDQDTDMIHLGISLSHSERVSTSQIILEVQNELERCLPRHCRPDFVESLDNIPVTKHGKFDVKSLVKSELTNLGDTVLKVIKRYVPPSMQNEVDNLDNNLLDMGIDSLKSVTLVAELEELFDAALSNGVPMILEGCSINDLSSYIHKNLKSNEIRPSATKKPRLDRYANGFQSTMPNEQRTVVESANFISRRNDSVIVVLPRDLRLKLEIEWFWDSKKCIDASPVILLSNAEEIVFIGSHSGAFAALRVSDGAEMWKVNLGRIVGSCTVTGNGIYTVVGSYDHCIHFVDIKTGQLRWSFETGDIVKSTPLAHQEKPFVLVGSHDHNFYCLNYENFSCEWKIAVEGAIVSRPCFDHECNVIFVGTLLSALYSLSINGHLLWSTKLGKPIFGGLNFHKSSSNTGLLLVPCVDGYIYGLKQTDGDQVMKFYCGGPLFGTVLVFGTEITVAVRSSEKENVICFSLQKYDKPKEIWRRKLESEIAGSPFMFSLDNIEDDMYCVLSKHGEVNVLRSKDGTVLTSIKLPGEIFSSPVVSLGGKILVGCRDNMLYCLKIAKY